MSDPAAVAALRARIESIERHAPEGGLRPAAHAQRRRAAAPDAAAGWGQALSFGCPELDDRFAAGGLPFGAHEVAGEAGEPAAGLLFALLLLARRLQAAPGAEALVVQEASALREGGDLYAPGLLALGIDPGRLILLAAPDGGEALRLTDEAVRSGALACVLTEAPRAGRRLDLAATQRLNLYGRETGTAALLLVPDLHSTSAAMTRWRVRSAPSRASCDHLGPPALELDLVKNRLGRAGRFTLQWNSDDEAFRPDLPAASAPLRPPLAAAAGDQPAGTPPRRRAAPGGRGHAEERASAVGGR